jgi:hypothetical protein
LTSSLTLSFKNSCLLSLSLSPKIDQHLLLLMSLISSIVLSM